LYNHLEFAMTLTLNWNLINVLYNIHQMKNDIDWNSLIVQQKRCIIYDLLECETFDINKTNKTNLEVHCSVAY